MYTRKLLTYAFAMLWVTLLTNGCGGISIKTPASSEGPSNTFTPPGLLSQPAIPPVISTVTPEFTVTSSDFVLVEPLVTAPFIQFASWSPDDQWIAYWISSQEDVEQPSNTMPGGTLNFTNIVSGKSCAISQFVAANNQWAEVRWSDEIEAIVVADKGTFMGKPCQPEPYSALANYIKERPSIDPTLSPDGQHHANTTLQSNENGILTFETTLSATNSIQPLQQVTWQIDERLGAYGLGGEWISKSQFLVHETLDQGPLIMDVHEGVIPVLTQLLGLEEVPSLLGREGYGFQALALPGLERDSFHLVVHGVGTEANFPEVKLYHAENGIVEGLPFRYIWREPFSEDGQWLLMDERPNISGYESHEIWIRRVEETGKDWERIASDVDSVLWTHDWSEMAFNSGERVIWQTFPEAEHIGQWSTSPFWTYPVAWSPNSRFLVSIGNVPGSLNYGLFVLEP